MEQHTKGDKMPLWRVVSLLSLLFISTNAYTRLRSQEEMSWLFKEWQVKFDKTYDSPWETEKRFEIFKDNLLYIDQHNDPRNNYTYTLGLNHFADLSHEEYQSKYLFPMERETEEQMEPEEYDDVDLEQLPESVDWRLQGSVSAVINQKSCGSCWAWAAAGAVEGFHHIQTGEMIRVSAQQLVDCVRRSNGCEGGWPGYAYDFIVSNNGVDSLENYPYTGKEGICKRNSAKLVTINGWKRVPPFAPLLQRVVAIQPVAVVLDAFGMDFALYDRGVFNGNCSPIPNHAILVVGYGSENGEDYWLGKNTWGFNWGEDGYIKIRRNVGGIGKCGILQDANYPY